MKIVFGVLVDLALLAAFAVLVIVSVSDVVGYFIKGRGKGEAGSTEAGPLE